MTVGAQTTSPVDIARGLGTRLAVGAAARDRDRVFPHEQLAELKASGLCGLWVPEESGGFGGDARDLVRVLVELAAGDPSVAQMYLIHTYGVALINSVHCSAELRESYYGRLVDDDVFITNAFSETSGKTVFDYKVKFDPTDSGDWRISGRKSYCTGSLGGDVFYVLGVCSSDREPVFRVALVDRDAAGLTVHDDWTGMGQRTTASGTVEFDDVLLPAALCFDIDHLNTPDSLFGSLGQCMFSAIFTGIARAALSDACEHVRSRSRPWPHADVERACDDPYVLHAAGRMQTLVSAAEAMVERAVDVRHEAIADLSEKTRDRASVAAAEAKIVCGETALEVSELLFQICGTGAVLEEFGLDRHWRNARTLTLHDPAAYKLRLIGDHALNGVAPPISVYT